MVLALRGVDGMAYVALWFSCTPRPSGRRACSRPIRTCGTVSLRGVDGMTAVAPRFSDTLTPVGEAVLLAPASDL